MILYAGTIFLSAFLLFQLQPIIARMILPWFGGTAAVWTTCMLFFQCALLLGYLYAHWSNRYLGAGKQALVHGILLAASLLALPVIPGAAWKPTGSENPTWRIVLLLSATVGLPYFLLSTTSPLVQAWFSRTRPGAIPYRLFALSNLGSMLALLSYPPLVEPNLSARRQALVWSAAYGLFAILCGCAAARGARRGGVAEANPEPDRPAEIAQNEEPRGPARHLLWAALAACPSILLLALTNHLTQDVAAIPFLWIVPLSLYLLSFILCFDAQGWYRRNWFLALLAPSLGGMTYLLWSNAKDPGFLLAIILFAAAFFVCCMVCHGELVRLKPHPRYLTSFYLMLSIGGAAGGLFVGLVAPYLFSNYFELPIGVLLCAVLVAVVLHRDPDLPFHLSRPWPARAVVWSAVFAIGLVLGRGVYDSIREYKVVVRNFYGSVRVRQTGQPSDWDGYRTLLHGSIDHGEQWTHPDRRREVVTYYCQETGIGRVMQDRRAGVAQRVAVLGLGTGTLAVFGRPEDHFRFYEINPLVIQLARSEFTYLKDSPAHLEIVLGDGRLSLEREPDGQFDVIAMDAFSGDSVPVHLLTREAFALYFRLLKPDGILAVHISNKHLDLQPVVERSAAILGKSTLLVETEESDDGNCFGTTWVLLAHSRRSLGGPSLKSAGEPLKAKTAVRGWTDDYSNLFRILK